MLTFIFLIVLGYLLGSIPFGYIIAKRKGIDIQKKGSGNTGATNISRNLGFKYALLVAILDILKGALPAYLAVQYLSSEWQIALVFLMPIIGHSFPVWLKFKGGKGVSTMVPALIYLTGWWFVLIFILWVIMLKITRVMSLNNLLFFFFVPFVIYIYTNSITYFILGIIFFLFILWTHRTNVDRLYKKEELKL
jgi:glycerol-3-phosphate acyltransferase PlsY